MKLIHGDCKDQVATTRDFIASAGLGLCAKSFGPTRNDVVGLEHIAYFADKLKQKEAK